MFARGAAAAVAATTNTSDNKLFSVLISQLIGRRTIKSAAT